MLLTVAIPSLMATDFKKVTTVEDLQVGKKVIITNTDASQGLGAQGKNNRSAANVIPNGDLITVDENTNADVTVLTLGKSDGKFTFYDQANNGYLYAASSSSNYLKTQTTLNDNGKATIVFSDGVPTIQFKGSYTRNLLRYNSTSTLFSCYSSGQQDVAIYQEYVPAAVADPKITVTDGTYFVGDDVNVTLSCEDAEATIHYTTDGTEPTAETPTKETSFVLNQTEAGSVTIKAIAVKNGKTSNVVSKVVAINPVANTVAEYNEMEPGTIVRFDCDLKISFANTNHIFAQDAAGNGVFMYSKSGIGEAANGKVIPAKGLIGKVSTYNSNKQLNFTGYSLPELTGGETIAPITVQFGALNGSYLYKYVMIPDVTLTKGADVMLYNVNGATGFLVNEYGSDNWPEDVTGKTFNIYGIYVNMGDSKGLYFIDAKAVEATLESPTLDVAGGIYDTEQTVNITAADGAEVRYTTNEAADIKYGVAGTDYTVGNIVTIDKSCTLRVIAVKGEEFSKQFSEVVSAIYTMKTATPTITAEAVDGVYSNEEGKLEVTISCPKYSDNVIIAYSVDGVEDTFEGNSKVITINETATIKATALYGDFEVSDEATATFTWNNPNVIENATVTGDIVFAKQDADKFIASGTNMKKDAKYILTDNLNNEYTITSTIEAGKTTYPLLQKNGTLRLYNTNGNVIYISNNNITITKVAISHNRGEITINNNSVAATDGVSTWNAPENCHQLTIIPTTSEKNTDVSAIAITYVGTIDYYKVKDGAALIGMEKGKFYQVNVALEGVEANGGVLYARTSELSAAPSVPGKTGFDKSYEDYDLTKFNQRDWVAIKGLGSEYEGFALGTFIAAYDGEKLTSVVSNPAKSDAEIDITNINTFGVANVFYGNYENTSDFGWIDGDGNPYYPFFVKAKVNEVANFVGKVTKDTAGEGGSFRLEGSGKCGVFEGKGVLLEAADGVTLSVSGEDYKEFKGVLVAETNNTLAQCGVKIVALSDLALKDPTGVAALKADGKATVYGTEGAVVVNGADGKVMIFDAMGRMVKSVNAEGAATVAMPAGYYIVRTAGTAAKVMVK